MENKYEYDLLVIGAGSGGLTAAIGGAGIGAKVLLIEGDKLGGDCTHYGCVPSKALIKTSRMVNAQKHFEDFGLARVNDGSIDIARVLMRVKDLVDNVEERFEDIEHIRSLGVDVIKGLASFVDAHTVEITLEGGTKQNVSAKKIVIATGARPVMLPIPGLAEIAPKTNRTIFEPRHFASLLIIGSGPIGAELGQAFARLGVKVSMVTRDTVPLGREEEEVGRIIAEQFHDEGIDVHYDKDIVRAYEENGQKYLEVKDKKSQEKIIIHADEILVAVGRRPNVENLNLDAIGVKYDKQKGIIVNTKTETSVSHIYAIGDVATMWKFTHYANHMGKVALANALLHFPSKVDAAVIPRVTFTEPEVASVGESVQELAQSGERYYIFDKGYDHVDRAITDRAEKGFMRITTDAKGRIKGATIVGVAAGEMINEVALAMKNNITIAALSDTIHAYPTFGYGLRNCADQFRQMKYTKSKRNLVKKIFGLRGK